MNILLVGASVRAAAYSAARAGMSPRGLDLFADADLAELAPCARADRESYPQSLERLAAAQPHSPWLYTGCLENEPELVDRIAAVRPLLGNSGSVLRAVRDPFAWTGALNRAGLPCPGIRSDATGLPRDGSWLRKPFRSCGGRAIAVHDEAQPSGDAHAFFQERIKGASFAATFIGDRAGAKLLGTTRQLLGRLGSPFAYVGSIGPVRLEPQARGILERIGATLVGEFELRGLFGVDFVLRGCAPYPVEINPRYTASVEVLELALARAFLNDHVGAFGHVVGEPDEPRIRPRTSVIGKKIVFAEEACRMPSDALPKSAGPGGFNLAEIADIPAPGTVFAKGEPVLTILCEGPTIEECERRLGAAAERWSARLADASAAIV